MKKQHLNESRQPSSTRVRHMREGVQARRDQRDIHFSRPARDEAQRDSRRHDADRDFRRAQLIASGGALALLAVVAAIAAGARGNDGPVDISKVPRGELSTFVVPSDGQSPELIGREVNDGQTDPDVLTAEAQQQIGSSAEAGTVVKFPTDQVNPAVTHPLKPAK